MTSEDLNGLEREALRIVGHGNGKYSWYQVARVLPVYDYPGQEHNTSKILRRLEQFGLLRSSIINEKGDPCYELTEAGLRLLGSFDAKPIQTVRS
jgi:hypothetical protein